MSDRSITDYQFGADIFDNFVMYIALINPEEGIDASGVYTDNRFNKLAVSLMRRDIIRYVFDNKGQRPPSEKEKDMSEKAREEALKAARENGWMDDQIIRGIKMRKQFAGVKGDIILAPVEKDFVDEIKDGEELDTAILLTQMATHVIEGNKLRRITKEEQDDIIEDLRLAKQKREISRRKSRRRHGGDEDED